ncbi:uncharacterized protein [Temnothorax nylanderi]|uniref:uncharacterized protein n=1 Tax=Temnothorax nylanderi TaxID=102681 RepID=UPI003A8546A1
MSGSSKDIIDYTKTSWIQELKKAHLTQILQKLEINFDAKANIDELRRVLRAHIEEVNKLAAEHNRKDVEDENDNKHGNNIIHTMTGNNVTKLEFHLGKDDWEMYAERLELYFVANDVKEEKQAAVLLTKISADTYKLVRDLCAPDKPSTKTFKDLVKLINDHLNPKPSETMERCKFHKAQQTETETVAKFAARLKSLAITCNFGDVSIALRDQFVCGLKDHATKTLLFREDKLTFETAYRLATTLEAAEKNASSTDKTNPTTETAKELVNKIHAKPNDRQFQSRGRGSYSGKRGSRRYNAKQGIKGNREASSNTNPKRSSACYCCGKNNHWARDCHHRQSTCNTCHKKGHLSTVCRAKGSIQQLQRDSEREEEQQDDYDFYAMTIGERISGNMKRTNVNMIADPMYLEVMINGKAIKMEIDTGSYVTVISKKDKDKYFPECKIEKSNMSLNAYGKVPLEHEGMMDNLNVKLGNRSVTLKMRVMKDRHPIPLIDEIFIALRNGKTFSQIDLQHAYMQIPVEESSRDYLTIITHKGLYKYTKMTEGKNDEDHLKALYAVFERLEQCGFYVNINKCEFFKEKLDILGFVIDKNGLHKSQTKVKAMTRPNSRRKKATRIFYWSDYVLREILTE